MGLSMSKSSFNRIIKGELLNLFIYGGFELIPSFVSEELNLLRKINPVNFKNAVRIWGVVPGVRIFNRFFGLHFC